MKEIEVIREIPSARPYVGTEYVVEHIQIGERPSHLERYILREKARGVRESGSQVDVTNLTSRSQIGKNGRH